MIGGLIPVASVSQLEEERKKREELYKPSPLETGLAAHVRTRWEVAKDAKRDVEERLLSCIRQRNGEYDPAKLQSIRKQGGSEIFMHLTSTKCRAASSWLRDTLLGTGAEKPWTLKHTPIPDLPEDVEQRIRAELQQLVMQGMQEIGSTPPPEMVKQANEQMKEQARAMIEEEARKRVERMERKMEDQLIEGGFLAALDKIIDDITTFPSAILKGPVLRKRNALKWNGQGIEVVEEIKEDWERVDPFMLYPAPWATSPEDGYLIERHKMSRRDLEGLIGVEGYSEAGIKQILTDFDGGGLREWLSVDTEVAEATGNSTSHTRDTDLIDALQLWDDIPGKLLIDFGLTEEEVPDKTAIYSCEVWLVGTTVIRAMLNEDPLNRKPYYVSSYEAVPGSFWGHGIAELIKDSQDMCNSAARALNNNMGLASGPQIGVDISRLPAGEDITQMFPWKIWQFQRSDYGDNSPPMQFFQPNSNAQELMAVFEKFSQLADEYSGVPRYMTGDHTPGAGRTASGLSMLINNAGKSIKQVIANIDTKILTPMLERLYYHNFRYSNDPDLIGDANIIARGAMSLVAKEAAAVRRNEFLQLALNSPVAQQIVGMQGTAELLRESAKSLDMSVDKVVPPREAIEQMMIQQQQAMMAQQQMAMQEGEKLNPDGSPVGGRDANLMANRAQ